MVAILFDLGYLHWRLTLNQTESSMAKLSALTEDSPAASAVSTMPADVVPVDCQADCLALVQQEVARAVATFSAQPNLIEKEKTSSGATVIFPTTSLPQISYLPLGSGGTTTSQSWTEVAGTRFVFDLADYSTSVSVIWEVNLRAEHANSRCYARIWDVSNQRAVDFSEQTTDSISSVNLTSLPLSIWQGKNDYYLEVKSLNGIQCYLDSPRLKIIN